MGKINTSPVYFHESAVSLIEELKQAKYVCETTCGQWIGNGLSWYDNPCLIFYSPIRHPQGSNWFSIFYRDNKTYISNGITATFGTILGIEADDGEIIYSRHRQNFVTSSDGSVWIDGGRDLPRVGFSDSRQDSPKHRLHVLRIIDDQLVDLSDYSTF